MIEELIVVLQESEKLSELTAEQFTDIFWLAIQQSRFSGRNNQEDSSIRKIGTQSGNAGTQSGTAGTQSGNAGTQSGNAGTQSGTAGTQSGNAGTQSGTAGTQSGNAGTQSGTAGTQSGTAGTQSGNALVFAQTDSSESKGAGTLPIRVPDATALQNKLELMRSLKPLMGRVPDLYNTVLDEVATIERIANEKLWIPVLKPAQEPCLELDLVVDEGASMLIWRKTILELRQLLETLGAFRNVRTWSLLTTNETQVQILPGIGSVARQQYARSPKELVDPNGRRLILVLSDCVSPVWRNGVENGVQNENIISTLNTWANSGPVAIVQMLPKWLWARTALGLAFAVQLSGQTPGVANQQLQVRQLFLWDEIDKDEDIKVPIFTLEPEMVATWSKMVAGMGTVWTSGVVFQSNDKKGLVGLVVFFAFLHLIQSELDQLASLFLQYYSKKDEPNESSTELTAKQRFQRFRLTASPMARRLAGLVAVAPIVTLPVIRLIQQTMLSQSSQIHVAEVLLGGLIELKPDTKIAPDINPNEVEYQFIDEVDEILIDSLPATDKAIVKFNLLEQLTKHIADKIGLSTDTFAGFLQDPRKIGSITQQPNPIARLAIQKLKNLGGRYADFAEQLETAMPKAELLESLKNQSLDVASAIQKIKATLPQITPLELGEILKGLLITQKIHDQFVEKFGGGQGNRFLTRNLQLSGEGNQIYLNKGGQINATMEINHNCPECGTAINQIIVGIAGENQAQACVWIGGSTSNGWQDVAFSLNIPYTPGVYYIRTRYAQAYNSEDALNWWKVDRSDGPTSEANIGSVVVGINHIFEYAGEYACAVKWGGETGTWQNESEPEHLLISSQGEVQFRSRFGLAIIQNLTIEGQTLSWNFDNNETAASINFKENSKNSYFWSGYQTGKLFEGWLNYPNEGRIDFRGRFVISDDFPSVEEFIFEVATITIELELEIQPFEFEVAIIELERKWSTLGRKAPVIKRIRQQAQCFVEDLPNGIQLKMVSIPEGSFLMGSSADEASRSSSESPQHQVTVPPFLMGKYPVTQAQWEAVASLPQVNRELKHNPSNFKGENRPVEQVSWYEAVEFCNRLSQHTGKSYCLPSEAEWEYACRAGTTTPFHFGEAITSELANYNAGYTYGVGVKGTYREETTSVGSFKIANAFGLYDMHGNVLEWCLDDWHSNYEGAPHNGSAWFNDNNKLSQKQGSAVLRGGSWLYGPGSCRSAYRGSNPSRSNIFYNIGFRVMCAASRGDNRAKAIAV
jgi:formylglycine-generating enzyme required for sulfatase activity